MHGNWVENHSNVFLNGPKHLSINGVGSSATIQIESGMLIFVKPALACIQGHRKRPCSIHKVTVDIEIVFHYSIILLQKKHVLVVLGPLKNRC